MDDTQPYPLSSPEVTSNTRTGATFDPLAVSPAFARNSSSHPPPASTSVQPNLSQDLNRTISALSEPSLLGELPNTDPLSILLQKHIPPHLRPVRDLSGTWHTSTTLDPFSEEKQDVVNEETVGQATLTDSWRKIASLARNQISNSAKQEVGLGLRLEEVLEWWSIRLYSLARLKLYSLFRSEFDALWEILVAEDLLERSGEGEKVPFTLRVLKATEPKYRGDLRGSIEQYTLLIQECKRKLKDAKNNENKEEGRIWRERGERIGLMLGFTLAEGKDWDGAMEVVWPLIERALSIQPKTETEGDGDGEEEASVERRVHLVLVASRIWIQAGDLTSVTSFLNRTSTLVPPTSPLDRQINHSKALIEAISGDFNSATSLLPSTDPSTEPNGNMAEQLNSAIIDFYSAHLDPAISQLDSVLANNPSVIANATVADSVIFNLATLYELGTIGGEAAVVERKRGLLVQVARWAGEPGVSSSSFKL